LILISLLEITVNTQATGIIFSLGDLWAEIYPSELKRIFHLHILSGISMFYQWTDLRVSQFEKLFSIIKSSYVSTSFLCSSYSCYQ